MSEPEGRGRKASGGGVWEDRPSFWWVPMFMFFMSILLGVCCLFYMSIGGLVLCVVHCVAGSIIALLTLGAYLSRGKIFLLMAAVLNVVWVALLFCTFIYTAWQLSQNAKAKHEADNESYSPLVPALMEQYAIFSVSGRRLSAVGGAGLGAAAASPLPLLGGIGFPSPTGGERRLSDSEGPQEGGETAPTDLQLYGLLPEGKRGGSAASEEELAALQEGHPFGFLRRREGGSPLGDSDGPNPLGPPTVRVAQLPDPFSGFELREVEAKCLVKAFEDHDFLESSAHTVFSLLNRRLACGYTQYDVGVFKKWSLGCDADCFFDGLNFGHHMTDEGKTVEKVQQFMDNVRSMKPATARSCLVMLQATSCLIEEKHYVPGVISALSIGLFFAFLLCIMAIISIVHSFTAMKKPAVRSTSAEAPPHHDMQGAHSSSSHVGGGGP